MVCTSVLYVSVLSDLESQRIYFLKLFLSLFM